MKFIAWAAVLALHAPHAVALDEDTLEFEGRWKLVLRPASGPERQALLVLSNYGGQWKETPMAANRRAPCTANKFFPVTVQKSVKTELEFSVWSAAVQPACSNLSITVAPTGAHKMVGSTPDGHTVTMTRR